MSYFQCYIWHFLQVLGVNEKLKVNLAFTWLALKC